MAYTTQQAILTLNGYMSVADGHKHIIDETKGRGVVITLRTGEQAVIFVYPLVHKQDNTKNYFDTRDSGAYERGITWKYALKNKLKYFCFGINDQVDKYKDYVFSLECNESIIETISGTKNGMRNGPGNQIIIPNDYVPSKKYERLKTKLGIYISVIHKDSLSEYMEVFDNRPYIMADIENVDETLPLVFNTKVETKFTQNRILFGAPGTGKSFLLEQNRKEVLQEDKNDSTHHRGDYERVTFHPDYTYAQFVGTYKPVSEGTDIYYKFVPGPFMRMYVKALKNGRTDNPEPYILLIEEINRAPVAAVFGDIFQLLDRDEFGVSQYEIEASEDIRRYLANELGGEPHDYEKIKLPNNLFIWATMNSADQGVFPMDTAFKRRWDFTYIGVDDNDSELNGKYVIVGSHEHERQKIEWNKLRKAINNFLAEHKINEDKQLGPYFISRSVVVPKEGNEIDSEKFSRTFKNKVLMYLFEDAAKQRRADLFKGSAYGWNRYSELCKAFDEQGIGIFNEDIQRDTAPEDININGRSASEGLES